MFQNAGGEFYNKINEIESQIKTHENEKASINEELKSIIGNYMPFLINKKSIPIILEQIKNESHSKEFDVFSNRFEDGTIAKLLKSTLGEISESSLNSFRNALLKEFENKGDSLHFLSYDDAEKIQVIANRVLNNVEEEILGKFSKIKEINEELPKLKATLVSVKDNKDIEEILKEISNENMKIGSFDKEIETLSSLIKTEKELYEKEYKLLSNLKDKVIKSKKDSNKFNVINKVQSVLEKYILKINEDKLDKVRVEFLEIFSSSS